MYIHTSPFSVQGKPRMKCWWTAEFIKYVSGNSYQLSTGPQLITQGPCVSFNRKTQTLCSFFAEENPPYVTQTERRTRRWLFEPWFPFCLLENERGNLPLPAAGEIFPVPVDSHTVLPKLFVTPQSDVKYVHLPALSYLVLYIYDYIFYCCISTSLYISSVINECDWTSFQGSACCMMELWILACCLLYIAILEDLHWPC